MGLDGTPGERINTRNSVTRTVPVMSSSMARNNRRRSRSGTMRFGNRAVLRNTDCSCANVITPSALDMMGANTECHCTPPVAITA